MIALRSEQDGDAAAIGALVTAAFLGAEHSSGTEAAIVDALRASGMLSVSLVAEEDGLIVGHVAFSPVTMDGTDLGWFGLGPVAVSPDHQRRGIGARLIEAGLARLRDAGAQGCVVLGDPAYYARFGFEIDPALVYPGVPAEYFQRLVLAGAAPTGKVAYHPSFAAS
ncbi:putative acetyltransferase [Novosphingobium sp. PhB165]|uniref:GNAT family N-acetyltransferase n=1 Tax=Novosphingobium sp. PhB165 TaxID=2485105 RepID=UPI0010E4CD91|nr:N-acetyltransferase [Novosphingobium sp. PhB165]TCM18974.1 putative acetyltransferase [Novosphingobium sp. PhB165]